MEKLEDSLDNSQPKFNWRVRANGFYQNYRGLIYLGTGGIVGATLVGLCGYTNNQNPENILGGLIVGFVSGALVGAAIHQDNCDNET